MLHLNGYFFYIYHHAPCCFFCCFFYTVVLKSIKHNSLLSYKNTQMITLALKVSSAQAIDVEIMIFFPWRLRICLRKKTLTLLISESSYSNLFINPPVTISWGSAFQIRIFKRRKKSKLLSRISWMERKMDVLNGRKRYILQTSKDISFSSIHPLLSSALCNVLTDVALAMFYRLFKSLW